MLPFYPYDENLSKYCDIERIVSHSDEVTIIDTEDSMTDLEEKSNASTIPPLQGDYAKTVFLWAFRKISPIKKRNEYQRYLLYECGIREPVSFHKQLIKEGYFQKASPQDSLKSLTNDNLKMLLRQLNQPVSGNKSILVQRIIDHSDKTFIKNNSPKSYLLSEKGKLFLIEHENYVKIHKYKDWDIDWKEYDAKHEPHHSFYDTMWSILNERLKNSDNEYPRSEYFHMYQLYSEEGKNYEALKMLLRIIYIDISGVYGIPTYKIYLTDKFIYKDVDEYFDSSVLFVPTLFLWIQKYKDVYSDDIINNLYEEKLPVQICSKEMFLWIVHSVLDGSFDEQITEHKLQDAYSEFADLLKKYKSNIKQKKEASL